MFTFTPSAAKALIVESCCATVGHVILLWPCSPTAATRTPSACSFLISAIDAVPLRRVLDRVVVVVQLRVRVGFVSELERLRDDSPRR